MRPTLDGRGPGGGASVSSAPRNGSHAEVVQRAAKEDWGLTSVGVGFWVEAGAGAGDDLDGFDQLLLAACAHQFLDLRIAGRSDEDRRRPTPAFLPLVQQHRLGFEIVDAAEVRSVPERPVHRCR